MEKGEKRERARGRERGERDETEGGRERERTQAHDKLGVQVGSKFWNDSSKIGNVTRRTPHCGRQEMKPWCYDRWRHLQPTDGHISNTRLYAHAQ